MISNKIDYSLAINRLNTWTELYDAGNPAVSDKEYDDLYFQVKEFENNTGIVFKNSPTQHIYFKTVSKLNKVTHNHLMLSLDKTKDLDVVRGFIGARNFIAMAKMDGLTCSLTYEDGKLVAAETRGNGIIGEDITHNAMVIPSILKTIPITSRRVVIDGEVICTYQDFEAFSSEYKNPRNFASGSIRLLNSKECSRRNLTFVAWDVIEGFEDESRLSQKLDLLSLTGFDVVPSIHGGGTTTLEQDVAEIRTICQEKGYPIDGIVFKYNRIHEYEEAGRTEHHFKGGLAYKFYDETYSTGLRYIDWTMGRTGVLTPVAVFNPIEIDGTEVTRASLHNYSIMKELLGDCAYVGEPLEIYKANQIIPQVASAGPHYDYGYVISHAGVSAHDEPECCPYCGGDIIKKSETGVTNLYCDNPTCSGKLINRLDHFCGKKGLDIKGISKATLEKLIDWEWVNCFKDLYRLKEHRNEWIKKSGFGEASVQKILNAFDNSRNPELWRVIAAAGIPNIGGTAAKQLANYFKTYSAFRSAIEDDFDFTVLPDFGDVMSKELLIFDYTEIDDVVFYALECKEVITTEANDAFESLQFCITGKLKHYKNRNELKTIIENLGGKVTDSVSSKTSYLVNNDSESTSSKNKTAKSLGIPIITEEELMVMILTT